MKAPGGHRPDAPGGRRLRRGPVLRRSGHRDHAGDFPAVVAGAEVVAGVALLDAVLAGGVAGQRPGEGDPVLAPSPLHVHHKGVAAVGQVLAGE